MQDKLFLPDIVGGGYRDFWFWKGRYRAVKGGRASKKSCTAALWHIYKMMQTPGSNTLVVRRYYNTHKDSTYAQLRWAIDRLQVGHLWRAIQSPLEIVYLPTGQKILFRGLDEPQSITSITVDRGSLCWVWVEEAFQISNPGDFDKLDMSIRGEVGPGLFKQLTLTFNPWHQGSWIKQRFFDQPDPEVLAMTTDYRCNEWLDDADRQVFAKMRQDDPARYAVEGLGNWGTTGKSVFNAEAVYRRLTEIEPPALTGHYEYDYDGLTVANSRLVSAPGGIISVYKEPEPGRPYVIGGDTAGDGSDSFVLQVIDNITLEQVATLKTPKLGEDTYARQAYCLGRYYNDALLSIECNWSTYPIMELERLKYPRQYVRETVDNYTHKTKRAFGFRTDKKTRPILVSGLISLVRGDMAIINDRATLDEMLTFVYNEDMRPEAEDGSHDDTIMALGIAYASRHQQRVTIDQPEPDRVEWTKDMIADYHRADSDGKKYLIKKWGRPKHL